MLFASFGLGFFRHSFQLAYLVLRLQTEEIILPHHLTQPREIPRVAKSERINMMNESLKNGLGFCARLLSYLAFGLVTLEPASAEPVIVIHPEAMAGHWVSAVSNESISGQISLELDLRTLFVESSERLDGISVSIGFGPSVPQGEPAVAGRTFNVLHWGFMCVDDKGSCDFDGTRLLVGAFRGPDLAHD